MAFTGAALSQALAGIAIPVVLCGAMRPLNTGADAEANLALALRAARAGRPGVRLAFDGKVLNAAGLVKHNAHGPNAFRSIPQAQAQAPVPFRPRRFADCRLAILSLSPELPARAIGAALDELDGAVPRVFGAGTVMSNPELERVLSAAVARGCRIRAVSQCEAGLRPAPMPPAPHWGGRGWRMAGSKPQKPRWRGRGWRCRIGAATGHFRGVMLFDAFSGTA